MDQEASKAEDFCCDLHFRGSYIIYLIAVLITCIFDALILFSDGEYHFVSNEEKVSKQAPKLWKTGPGEVTFSFLGVKALLVFPLLHLADLPNSLENYVDLII